MGAPGGGEAFLVDRLTTRGFSSISSNTPHSGHPVTYRPDPSNQDEKRSVRRFWMLSRPLVCRVGEITKIPLITARRPALPGLA
jgi:hypothetical protein